MINRVLDRIGARVPTQRKKIERFHLQYPDAKVALGSFLDLYAPFMEREEISIDTVVDSYLEMVNQMLHSRLEFVRTGRYPTESEEDAFRSVYSNQSTMQQYMLGLAMSYFLWRHQFQLLAFYRQSVKDVSAGKRFMEVGCGHGLLLLELLKRSSQGCLIDVIDISSQSIHMTRKLLETSFPGDSRCAFHHCNIFDFDPVDAYDFITVGEVLEHVDKPATLLANLAGMLAIDGRLFVTTCANCPAVDHVYHFESIGEIRDIIATAGLAAESEVVAPSEERDSLYLEKNRVDISYAAVLKKVK